MKQRLADVVDRLPDEVRHQLLRVVPNDDPRKCDLLTAVLDDLPTQRLLDLVPRVEMKRGTHVSPFLTFLVRLCSVAGREASVSEAVEAQLGRFDLPTDLVARRAAITSAPSSSRRSARPPSTTARSASCTSRASTSSRSRSRRAPTAKPRRLIERRAGREGDDGARARGSPSPWSVRIRATRRRSRACRSPATRRRGRSRATASCRCSPSSPPSRPSLPRRRQMRPRTAWSRSAWRCAASRWPSSS